MEATLGHPELREILATEEEIEAILGKPAPRMLAKVIDTLGRYLPRFYCPVAVRHCRLLRCRRAR